MIIDENSKITNDKIIIDESVDVDKLGWKFGDCFKITNINGQVMLIKLDPVEQFNRGISVNKDTP